MSNVIKFDGLTKLDLPPDQILEEAKDKLQGCMVIGYETNGDLYVASSYADARDILWVLEQVKAVLFEMEKLDR